MTKKKAKTPEEAAQDSLDALQAQREAAEAAEEPAAEPQTPAEESSIEPPAVDDGPQEPDEATADEPVLEMFPRSREESLMTLVSVHRDILTEAKKELFKAEAKVVKCSDAVETAAARLKIAEDVLSQERELAKLAGERTSTPVPPDPGPFPEAEAVAEPETEEKGEPEKLYYGRYYDSDPLTIPHGEQTRVWAAAYAALKVSGIELTAENDAEYEVLSVNPESGEIEGPVSKQAPIESFADGTTFMVVDADEVVPAPDPEPDAAHSCSDCGAAEDCNLRMPGESMGCGGNGWIADNGEDVEGTLVPPDVAEVAADLSAATGIPAAADDEFPV